MHYNTKVADVCSISIYEIKIQIKYVSRMLRIGSRLSICYIEKATELLWCPQTRLAQLSPLMKLRIRAQSLSPDQHVDPRDWFHNLSRRFGVAKTESSFYCEGISLQTRPTTIITREFFRADRSTTKVHLFRFATPFPARDHGDYCSRSFVGG